MKTKWIASAALMAALAMSGAAQAANNSCVWVRNLDDFKPAQDEKSLMISDSPSHKYTVTFLSRCIGLRFTESIAVRSVGGLFCLTPGDSVSFGDNGIRQSCMISKIEPLAPKPATDSSSDSSSNGQPSQPTGY